MIKRVQVISEHRAEGEPRTMARVEGMCEERWPGKSFRVWIEHVEGGPRRHVAVTFARDIIEGSSGTWLDAMDAVDADRQQRRIGY